MPAIVVEDLRKDYGPLHAVDGVSFEVADGEVCALLGPNGAGKTTTVEILEGHRTATSGTASVLGMDPATGGRAFRERIGIVLQEAGFDESQTVHDPRADGVRRRDGDLLGPGRRPRHRP
jgi:ABC-2 type transport system ATP-binding protein